jgi:hypothetical protein
MKQLPRWARSNERIKHLVSINPNWLFNMGPDNREERIQTIRQARHECKRLGFRPKLPFGLIRLP